MVSVLFRSRWLLKPDGRWIEGGGLLSVDGRIRRLPASGAALRRASASCDRIRDLGDGLIVPGLVNAHAHLELTGMQGRLPRAGGFGAWIRRLIELRNRRTPSQLALDARRGARRCVASGATLVTQLAVAAAVPVGSRQLARTRQRDPRATHARSLPSSNVSQNSAPAPPLLVMATVAPSTVSASG